MQSFIINIPDEKVDFFLELADMLSFEVLEMEEEVEFETYEEEQEEEEEEEEEMNTRKKKNSTQQPRSDENPNDPFLDWEAERKNAKKNKY